MKELTVSVSLANGHVVKLNLERESVDSIIEELYEGSGKFNEGGVAFSKDDVVSVEASEKKSGRVSSSAKTYMP
ncbi:hypothetical protein [Halobacillus massiliensis]|uniref:hypothetical protein n=1 Tax=Halobacillus massiliensis TaxID=1926286 RepID=UPI0009E20D65|nr:hypothetical protein [Halobacillus massiliensis]